MFGSSNVIDISRMISPNAVVYPGDAPVGVNTLCTIEPGCPCNISTLSWTTHILTHVDAPLHFVKGAAPLEAISLDRFCGPALVVEVDGDSVLPRHFPAEREVNGKNLLFKTRNSQIDTNAPFDEGHVYVSHDLAMLAVKSGVNLVGIDYLSVDRFGDENYPVHRELLSADVLILEGLDLTSARGGWYNLIAFPLNIQDGDGSPVRAILLEK